MMLYIVIPYFYILYTIYSLILYIVMCVQIRVRRFIIFGACERHARYSLRFVHVSLP